MQFSNFKDLKISKIGFGCAGLSGSGGGYGFGEISDSEANSLVHRALDREINLFDNAPIYGFGEAERRLGLALKNKRHDALIVSKCGVNWHENKRVDMNNDPDKCLDQLHSSLKRLKTDYIDIYMVHWPDSKYELEETFKPLLKAKQDGKIRFLGLSNFGNFDIDGIDFLQGESNLFQSTIDSQENKFTQAWGTLDKGILSGSVKVDSVFENSNCRKKSPWWKKSNWKEKVQKSTALFNFLKSREINPIEFAIRYNTDYRSLSQTLCGFKNISHLEILDTLWSREISDSDFKEGHKLVQGEHE